MNIEITREEYDKLVDILYIAERVLNGYGAGEDRQAGKYDGIIQKLYALAEPMGQGRKILYDGDLGKYVPGEEFEQSSEARKFLDGFADETFWHELMYRFTERDLERQLGGYENVQRLGPDERFDLETPIEERYADEFEEHGIERLEIVERFGVDGAGPKTSD